MYRMLTLVAELSIGVSPAEGCQSRSRCTTVPVLTLPASRLPSGMSVRKNDVSVEFNLAYTEVVNSRSRKTGSPPSDSARSVPESRPDMHPAAGGSSASSAMMRLRLPMIAWSGSEHLGAETRFGALYRLGSPDHFDDGGFDLVRFLVRHRACGNFRVDAQAGEAVLLDDGSQ